MEELIKILNTSDNDIEQYVDGRIEYLNSLSSNIEEVSLGEDDGEIYEGWINTNVSYLPSGTRSKGFKLTKQFYIDFCKAIKENFGQYDITVVKSKFNSERLIKWINLYLPIYFGEICDDDFRKDIYGYGKLSSIGETLNIEEIKGKKVARCIEKSGGFNGLANFIGIDCSLVVSDATVGGNTTGHAYCLLQGDEKSRICDPNFFDETVDENGKRKSIPFIFDLDTNNRNNSVTFNSGELGGMVQPTIIHYDFPWAKLKTRHKTIDSRDIATADKNQGLTSSEVGWMKNLISRLSDKLRNTGEKQ